MHLNLSLQKYAREHAISQYGMFIWLRTCWRAWDGSFCGMISAPLASTSVQLIDWFMGDISCFQKSNGFENVVLINSVSDHTQSPRADIDRRVCVDHFLSQKMRGC